jgi:membrane associated rhomboid family serine protease
VIPLWGDRRIPATAWSVYAIVAVNVCVFVVETRAPHPDALIAAFGVIPYDVTHDVVLPPPAPPFPPLTLISAQFVHGSLAHIGFNMLFLLVFGPAVEYRCGHLRFLAYYLLCGTVGGVTQILWAPASHVPEIGASGAIAGVLGGYLVSYPFARIGTIVPIGCFPLFLRLPALLVIGLWALAQFVAGYGAIGADAAKSSGGVAYFAHLGGFCTGVLMIGLVATRSGGPR